MPEILRVHVERGKSVVLIERRISCSIVTRSQAHHNLNFFVVPAVMSLSYMVRHGCLEKRKEKKNQKQMLNQPKRYERQAGGVDKTEDPDKDQRK